MLVIMCAYNNVNFFGNTLLAILDEIWMLSRGELGLKP